MLQEKEKSMQEKLKKSDEEYTKKLQDIENQKYNLKLKEMEILRHDQMLVLLILVQFHLYSDI